MCEPRQQPPSTYPGFTTNMAFQTWLWNKIEEMGQSWQSNWRRKGQGLPQNCVEYCISTNWRWGTAIFFAHTKKGLPITKQSSMAMVQAIKTWLQYQQLEAMQWAKVKEFTILLHWALNAIVYDGFRHMRLWVGIGSIDRLAIVNGI